MQPSSRKLPSLANILRSSPKPAETHEKDENDSDCTVSRPSSGSSVDGSSPAMDGKPEINYKLHAVDFRVPNYQRTNGARPQLPFHGRKHSLDSLMTAAKSLEDDSSGRNSFTTDYGIDIAYQARMGSVIELKNEIFDTIRQWPITKASDVTGPHKPFLLDCLPAESIEKVLHNSERLATEARNLLVLKQHLAHDLRAQTQANYTHEPQLVPLLPSPHEMLTNIHFNPIAGPAEYFDIQRGAPPRNAVERDERIDTPAKRRLFSSPQMMETKRDAGTLPPALRSSSSSRQMNTKEREPPQFKVEKPHKSKGFETTGSVVKYPEHASVTVTSAFNGDMKCVHCASKDTPEWRRGPYGSRTVCNACGLFYGKLVKRFGAQRANIMMHYRRTTVPEDRRVPNNFIVPEAFINALNSESNLNRGFSAP